jgi:transposase
LAYASGAICEVYHSAANMWKEHGIKTVSTDEKTGMQALERNAADLPLRAGHCRKQEYEYIRHGTLCLTANWDVAEGKIIAPTIGETRTEEDFQQHIEHTVQSDPSVKQWRFVVDNLNTHKSEALVQWVASLTPDKPKSLGQKGRSGVLKNMESRAAFLADPQHPVYFIYTPKHCSWLNQIEIWFSILAKKLLRYGNFISKDHLKERIQNFIDYFNTVLAKPFKWNYKGKPLSS